MSALEDDLHKHRQVLLLSDEFRRTINDLSSTAESKNLCTALQALIDMEACDDYEKTFKTAKSVLSENSAFY